MRPRLTRLRASRFGAASFAVAVFAAACASAPPAAPTPVKPEGPTREQNRAVAEEILSEIKALYEGLEGQS